MAERGVLIKDRTEMVIVVTDRTGLRDSVREILFKGACVNLFEALVRESFSFVQVQIDRVCIRWLCGQRGKHDQQLLVHGVVL